MENLIILAVVAVILALSGRYLYRAKKRGARCIGCPSGCSCSGKCSGCGEGKRECTSRRNLKSQKQTDQQK